jgi:hypothetical protein
MSLNLGLGLQSANTQQMAGTNSVKLAQAMDKSAGSTFPTLLGIHWPALEDQSANAKPDMLMKEGEFPEFADNNYALEDASEFELPLDEFETFGDGAKPADAPKTSQADVLTAIMSTQEAIAKSLLFNSQFNLAEQPVGETNSAEEAQRLIGDYEAAISNSANDLSGLMSLDGVKQLREHLSALQTSVQATNSTSLAGTQKPALNTTPLMTNEANPSGAPLLVSSSLQANESQPVGTALPITSPKPAVTAMNSGQEETPELNPQPANAQATAKPLPNAIFPGHHSAPIANSSVSVVQSSVNSSQQVMDRGSAVAGPSISTPKAAPDLTVTKQETQFSFLPLVTPDNLANTLVRTVRADVASSIDRSQTVATPKMDSTGSIRQIELQLVPKSLGVVNVTIQRTETGMTILANVSTLDAEKVLYRETSAINEAMKKAGLVLDEIKITFNPSLEQSQNSRMSDPNEGHANRGGFDQAQNDDRMTNDADDGALFGESDQDERSASSDDHGKDDIVTAPKDRRSGVYL